MQAQNDCFRSAVLTVSVQWAYVWFTQKQEIQYPDAGNVYLLLLINHNMASHHQRNAWVWLNELNRCKWPHYSKQHYSWHNTTVYKQSVGKTSKFHWTFQKNQARFAYKCRARTEACVGNQEARDAARSSPSLILRSRFCKGIKSRFIDLLRGVETRRPK